MKAPTETQLRAMTPEGRMLVRQRAAKLNNELGNETVVLIDSLHLPLSSGGMSENHPVYREMQEVIWSAEAKSAAIQAVENGHPAMAGVDPILQRVMGERYGREYQGTMNAGYIVGELMRYLGYEKVREAPLPEGCVARTAATWRPIGSTGFIKTAHHQSGVGPASDDYRMGYSGDEPKLLPANLNPGPIYVSKLSEAIDEIQDLKTREHAQEILRERKIEQLYLLLADDHVMLPPGRDDQ